jgi:putative ABC transport system substrate-binding protein
VTAPRFGTGAFGLALVLLMLALPALGQVPPDRVYRLAALSPVALDRSALIPELARLGFVAGRNLVIDERIGDGGAMPDLARAAVGERPDAILVVGQAALSAAQAATGTTPIVTFGNDPFGMGLAASLARPGRKVTGIVFGLSWELDAKRLDLLHQALPAARRIGVLLRRSAEGRPEREQDREAGLRAAAAALGIELAAFGVDGPEGYAAAFSAMSAAGVEALVLAGNIDFVRDAAVLARHAIGARLPMVCEGPALAAQGCLLGYGPSLDAIRRRVAGMIAQVFRGAAPADLPIETPSTFAFAINLRTARMLGVAIPQGLLIRADDVIE